MLTPGFITGVAVGSQDLSGLPTMITDTGLMFFVSRPQCHLQVLLRFAIALTFLAVGLLIVVFGEDLVEA